MSSRTKTSLLERTPNKTSAASPRINKLSRSVSKTDSNTNSSPLQATRLVYERSPNSANSKQSTDRKSPKPSPPIDKPPIRASKILDLQAQLALAQEDLKKASEQIALIENEKQNACEELTVAQALATKANEKLEEALAQRKADEDIEKVKAVEIEQRGIEAARRKEQELTNEIEEIKNKHSLDLSSLSHVTEELQRIKQELSISIEERNRALIESESQTEKAEQLSSELANHKATLESISQRESSEVKEMMVKIKNLEEKLAESESFIGQLSVDLAAKMTESDAHQSAEEWRGKFEELEMEIKQSGKLERSASESLGSVMRQLEESNDYLHEAEDQIASLKEKLGLLEMTISRQKIDLENSEKRSSSYKAESLSTEIEMEAMKVEMEGLKEERFHALENEKLAASSVQTLLEEKNKLINEIECARAEEAKSKKAMETLASALHEVSDEAREAKEMLNSHRVEKEGNESQIEDLKLVLKTTNEKYESMLDESKHENDTVLKSMEEIRTKHDALAETLRKSEERNELLEGQMERALSEMKSEMGLVEEALEEFKSDNLRLKEMLLDKETEMQNILQENADGRLREAAAMEKVEALSELLAATQKENGMVEEKQENTAKEKNGMVEEKQENTAKEKKEISDEEKKEFSDKGDIGPSDKVDIGLSDKGDIGLSDKEASTDVNEGKAGEGESEKAAEMELSDGEKEYALLGKGVDFNEEREGYKMWESYKVEEEEGISKEHVNGTVSPTKLTKKKSLYKKFGSLLKKKTPLTVA